MRISALCVSLALLGGGLLAPALAEDETPRPETRPLDAHAYVAGFWEYMVDRTSIGGHVYRAVGRTYLYEEELAANFDVRGLDRFTTVVGVPDDVRVDRDVQVRVLVDNQEVWRQDVRSGAPQTIDLPLTGKSTLRLEWTGARAKYLVFAEPTLHKIPVVPITVTPAEAGPETITPAEPTAPTGPFVVDANDLRTLMDKLGAQIEAAPAVKLRATQGIALSTFALIDIDRHEVATVAAEDMSSMLVSQKYQLLSRGVLDGLRRKLKLKSLETITPQVAHQLADGTNCGLLLTGSIADHGQNVVVNARLIDLATGMAVAAERMEMLKVQVRRDE